MIDCLGILAGQCKRKFWKTEQIVAARDLRLSRRVKQRLTGLVNLGHLDSERRIHKDRHTRNQFLIDQLIEFIEQNLRSLDRKSRNDQSSTFFYRIIYNLR